MLRDNRILTTRASAGARFAVLGVLLLAAFAVAGLRAPLVQAQNEEPQTLLTQSEQPKQSADQANGLTLTYIPRGAIGAAAARVADIYAAVKSPQLDRLIEESGFEKRYGLPIPLEAIQQVTVVFTEQEGEPDPLGFVVSTKNAGEARKMLEKLVPKEEYEYSGRKYFGFLGPENAQMYLPDDRTVIVVPPSRRGGHQKTAAQVMESFIDASLGRGAMAYDWMNAFRDLHDSEAAVAFDVTWLPQALQQRTPGTPQGELAAAMKMFAPLWLKTRTFALGASFNGGMTLKGIAYATSDKGAERVEETANALLTLARNLLEQGREQIAQAPAPERQLTTQIITLGEGLLKSAKVTRDNSTVRLQTQAEGDGATALIAAQVFPAVSEAREAARRAQAKNNLKQIALAMHTYHGIHGHFPPAIVLGPDGKTPHSWRVALLPFLEQKAIYEQYRLYEPWDSEHNKKILEQIPAVLANPGAPKDTTNTAYFVFTGPTAPFSSEPSKEGPKIRSITDGTSNTIMAVEAKREIPWTKPEDIPYDADKPLPGLGGFWDGGFHTALCDGAVKFVSEKINEDVLRGLITPARGERIGEFDPPRQP